jgi:hypothetical protein
MKAKILTKRELEIFHLALNEAMKNSVNSRIDTAKNLAKMLSFSVDEDDLEELCEEVEGS